MIVKALGLLLLISSTGVFLTTIVMSNALIQVFHKPFAAYIYFALNTLAVFTLVKIGIGLIINEEDSDETEG